MFIFCIDDTLNIYAIQDTKFIYKSSHLMNVYIPREYLSIQSSLLHWPQNPNILCYLANIKTTFYFPFSSI